VGQPPKWGLSLTHFPSSPRIRRPAHCACELGSLALTPVRLNDWSSQRRHIAVRGKSRARRVQTVIRWRADVFANRPDSTSSAHFGIESLAENAEIAEAGQRKRVA